MTELLRSSPLTALRLPLIATGFELRELASVAKVRLQAFRDQRWSQHSGQQRRLPVIPNTAVGFDPVALWMGPEDWLVYSVSLTADQILDSLRDIITAAPLIATDASPASIVLELRGPRALDILMRDCTLDLEGGAIQAGACAQTSFAQVSVLIHRLAGDNAWRMFVERPVAMHVFEWLSDTAGP